MSKKFFSLLKKGTLHLAPNKKVIPAKELETLLDAKEILKTVQEEAKEYRKEVAAECEKLKEQAKKEGYEAGFKEWSEEILKFQERTDSLKQEYTSMLAPVALKATQKIVGKAFELSDDLIFQLVENALKPVLQHKRITIYVNREDISSLEKHREDLKKLFESIEILSIRERDDITKGGLVIETEGGIINARLENQWGVLEQAFEKLFESTTNKIETEPVT